MFNGFVVFTISERAAGKHPWLCSAARRPTEMRFQYLITANQYII
jgi:hypothetical protein